MADENAQYYYDIIESANYGFDYNYCISFLTPKSYSVLSAALSSLRKIGAMSGEDCCTIREIWRHYERNYYKIKELDYQQPRRIAQQFIGKKNVRYFIFKRDGDKCLNPSCKTGKPLTIDHIVPIHLGGENKLSNLQTLCKSCNSSKGTKIIDYR